MTNTARSPIPSHPSDFACIDLVNSRFADHLGRGDAVDRIPDRRWLDWFLDWHRLKPKPSGPPPMDELVVLRRDVRRILDKWRMHSSVSPRDARVLDRWISGVLVRHRVTVTDMGLELRRVPLRRDWDSVLADVATTAVALIATGEPQRMKVCANPACSWVFYDNTINRSRQFCSTTPCASLVRVRKFRQHHRDPAST